MTASIHRIGRATPPSLDPLMALVAEDMNNVNAVILERMQSRIPLIPELAGHLIAGGGKRITRMYVTGPGSAPVTPCGGCRQRIREFADQDVVVISHGIDGAPLSQTVAQLLPHSFGPEYLPK